MFTHRSHTFGDVDVMIAFLFSGIVAVLFGECLEWHGHGRWRIIPKNQIILPSDMVDTGVHFTNFDSTTFKGNNRTILHFFLLSTPMAIAIQLSLRRWA